jgi:S1-C subfamily serine protease
MDILDAVVVLVAVAAAVGGYRMGFFARAGSWVGIVAGVYVAARFLPQLLGATGVASSGGRLGITVGLLVAGAFLGQLLGLFLGSRIHDFLPPGPLRQGDRLVGSAAGAFGVLVVLWLLIPTLASVNGWPARQAQDSAIARYLNDNFPRPPNTFQALRRLVGQQGFPQVFNGLAPGGSVGAPPAGSPLPAATVAAVAQSTVKVEGQACNRVQDGSGFAVGPDLIATNAHVVAGEPPGRTEVITYAGRVLAARVVMFDPNRDVALLAVAHLDDAPLAVAAGGVGAKGDIFGHPEGQDALAVIPALVASQITAVGSNLYDTASVSRPVFILAAHVVPGDSGGALVNTRGDVIGVTFATDAADPQKAYALSYQVLDQALAEPRGYSVSTRGCLNS